mgnify:FL=1
MAEGVPAAEIAPAGQELAVPPLAGALIKNEQDQALFEKLVQMQRHRR